MALFGAIGNGKVAHELVNPNEPATLDGKTATKLLDTPEGYKMCKDCKTISDNMSERLTEGNNSATIVPIDSNSEKGKTMAATPTSAKKTTTAAKKLTPEEETATREEIASGTERVKALALEGKDEAAEELRGEIDGLIRKLPRGEHAGLRATLRKAKSAKPEPEAAPTAEVAKVSEFESDEELVKLAAAGTAKIQEGAAVARQTNDVARDLAKISLSMRLRGVNKAGLPDLTSMGKKVKDAMSTMYVDSLKGVDSTDGDAEEAVYTLQRSVQNMSAEIISGFVWSLNESDEHHGLFAKPLEESGLKFADDVSPAERVFRLYAHHGITLPRVSAAEKRRLERALAAAKKEAKELEPAVRELAEKAGVETGEGEGEGEGTAESRALETLDSEVEKLSGEIEKLTKTAKKLDDAGKAAAKDKLRAVSDKLTALVLGL